MLNIFESKVLDDLYDVRGDGFESDYIKHFGKCDELKKSEIKEKELQQIINLIEDEELKKNIKNKINEFEDSMLGEMYFWNKEYYKLGIFDGINFKSEIRNLKERLSSKGNETATNCDT